MSLTEYNQLAIEKSLSASTTKQYLFWFRMYLNQYGEILPETALAFLSELKEKRSYQNVIQAHASLNFWFKWKNGTSLDFEKPKPSLAKIEIPDDETLLKLLEHVDNPKYKLVFTLSYEMALPLHSIYRLKIADIGFEHGVLINVKNSLNIIPPTLLAAIKQLAEESVHVSSQYIFRSPYYPPDQPIDSESLRLSLDKAARAINIPPQKSSVFYLAAIRRFLREGHSLKEARKVFGYKLFSPSSSNDALIAMSKDMAINVL